MILQVHYYLVTYITKYFDLTAVFFLQLLSSNLETAVIADYRGDQRVSG